MEVWLKKITTTLVIAWFPSLALAESILVVPGEEYIHTFESSIEVLVGENITTAAGSPGGTFYNANELGSAGVIQNNYELYNSNLLRNKVGGVFNNSGNLENTPSSLSSYLMPILYNGGVFNNTGRIFNLDGAIQNDGDMRNETGGNIENNGYLENWSGARLHNNGDIENNRDMWNEGVIDNMERISNEGDLHNSGIINNKNGAHFNNARTMINGGGAIINNDSGAFFRIAGSLGNSGLINNFGVIDSDYGIIDNNGSLNNFDIISNRGWLHNGGSLDNAGYVQNYHEIENQGVISNLIGGSIDNGNGSSFNNQEVLDNEGTFYYEGFLSNGGTILNSGVISGGMDATTFNSGIFSNEGSIINRSRMETFSGSTIDNSGTFINEMHGWVENQGMFENNPDGTLLNDGFFRSYVDQNWEGFVGGSGTFQAVNGTTTTFSGSLSPGNSPGNLTLSGEGSYVLGDDATLSIELGGLANGFFDTVTVTGGANFEVGGVLDLDYYGDFDGLGLLEGDYFDLILADSLSYLTGEFDSVDYFGAPLGNGYFWDLSYLFDDYRLASLGDHYSYVRLTVGFSEVSFVSEPGNLALLGLGLAVLGFRHQKVLRALVEAGAVKRVRIIA